MNATNTKPKCETPIQHDKAPELMRIPDAAGVAHVSTRTIRRAIWEKKLQASRMGRVYIIRREWLFDWIERGKSPEVAG